MEKEEFTIRVTRKGELLVDLRGLPPRRVQELTAYLEETLGPTREVLLDSAGDATGHEELVVEETEREPVRYEQEEETKPRLRILSD